MRRRGGRGWEGEVGSNACVLSAKVATTCVSRRRGERGWRVGRIFTVLGDMHERKLRRSIKGFRAQPPGKPVRMRIKLWYYGHELQQGLFNLYKSGSVALFIFGQIQISPGSILAPGPIHETGP